MKAPSRFTAPRLALGALLLGIYSTLYVARIVSNALRDAGWLKRTVAIAFALVAAAVLGGAMRVPALRRPRTLLLFLAAAGAYALVVWPMDSPEEKLHFVEYGLVGVLAFLSMPAAWTTARRALAALLFTGAAGWLDEGIQAVLPNRYYDLRDVAFNAAAGAMAIATFLALRFFAARGDGGA